MLASDPGHLSLFSIPDITHWRHARYTETEQRGEIASSLWGWYLEVVSGVEGAAAEERFGDGRGGGGGEVWR